jgi:YHS domain-containing protein
MMLKKSIMVGAVVLSLLFSGSLLAADSPGKGNPQVNCPVMGGTIDKSVYTDYQGKRIYFCCSGCVEDFKKNPDKYLKKMEEQGVQLEKAPGAK